MKIISHRGYWQKLEEKNTEDAFKRSFNLSIGTETDVRDHCGELVLSHDIPTGNEMTLKSMLRLLGTAFLPLALNIKADGLATELQSVMQAYDRKQWFVFDMSIPDMRAHLACGNPVYARVSEYEPEPIFFDAISGIWLDAFEHDGWQLQRIESWLSKGKQVCLVSPELHGREHISFWQTLRDASYLSDTSLMLCTDFPAEAQQFFGVLS